MNAKIPLAIFTYNRPNHAQRLFDAVGKNRRLDEVDIWIFCDAPKKPEHKTTVQENRAIVHRWAASIGATVRERDTNLGTAGSIVSGANELVEKYGSVIILEDDLVIAPDFLHFMLEGLRRYADCPKVMQISGHLPPDTGASPTSGLFLPLTTAWGWATWARAWRNFKLDSDISLTEFETNSPLRNRLNLEGRCPFFERLLRHCLEQPGEVWDIFWWLAVAKADGLVLYPNRSLVWNGGFDGSGVHCGYGINPKATAPTEYQFNRLSAELTWPSAIETDRRTFKMTQKSLALMFGDAGLLTRIEARLRKIAKRFSFTDLQQAAYGRATLWR